MRNGKLIFVYFISVLGFLAASCVEEGATISVGREITANSVVGAVTKSASAMDGSASFLLSAFDEADSGDTFFLNIPFSRYSFGGVTAWHGGTQYNPNPKYWPFSGSYRFWGYTDFVAQGSSSAAVTKFSLTIPEGDNSAAQKDVVVCCKKEVEAPQASAVDLVFDHIHAAVSVTARAARGYDSSTNTGIEVTGLWLNDAYHGGICRVVPSGTAGTSISWAEASLGSYKASQAMFSGSRTLTTSASALATFLLPPQPVDGLTVRVAYRQHNGKDAYSAPVNQDFEYTFPFSEVLSAGVRNVYALNFDMGKVTVTSSLASWEEVEGPSTSSPVTSFILEGRVTGTSLWFQDVIGSDIDDEHEWRLIVTYANGNRAYMYDGFVLSTSDATKTSVVGSIATHSNNAGTATISATFSGLSADNTVDVVATKKNASLYLTVDPNWLWWNYAIADIPGTTNISSNTEVTGYIQSGEFRLDNLTMSGTSGTATVYPSRTSSEDLDGILIIHGRGVGDVAVSLYANGNTPGTKYLNVTTPMTWQYNESGGKAISVSTNISSGYTATLTDSGGGHFSFNGTTVTPTGANNTGSTITGTITVTANDNSITKTISLIHYPAEIPAEMTRLVTKVDGRSSKTMTVGSTATMTAVLQRSTDGGVTWNDDPSVVITSFTSSNTSVVTVSGSTATAVAVGSSTMRGVYVADDYLDAEITVIELDAVYEYKVVTTVANPSISVGGTTTATAKLYRRAVSVGEGLSWGDPIEDVTSYGFSAYSGASFVNINGNQITGASAGSAEIQSSYAAQYYENANVTVTGSGGGRTLTGIHFSSTNYTPTGFNPSTMKFYNGCSVRVYADYSDGSQEDITNSSDLTITSDTYVTVSSGTLRAVSTSGQTTDGEISAQYGDKEATANYSFKNYRVPVLSLTFNGTYEDQLQAGTSNRFKPCSISLSMASHGLVSNTASHIYGTTSLSGTWTLSSTIFDTPSASGSHTVNTNTFTCYAQYSGSGTFGGSASTTGTIVADGPINFDVLVNITQNLSSGAAVGSWTLHSFE